MRYVEAVCMLLISSLLISSGQSLISHYVNLDIVVPEATIQGSASGEHHVDVGSIIDLICIIDNSPTPPQYVFWYHNDKMINYDNARGGITVETALGPPRAHSRLTIQNTKQADSGNYTCSASNTEPASIHVFISKGDNVDAILMRKSCAICVASQLFIILFPLFLTSLR
uniref:Ig-like domain-containing protein n=1 Tax=Dendroctonus ponderosae TaxID=77166 RepID=A0AAR5Q934_DENPD